MSKATILVVDDDPNNFDVIEALLSSLDYSIYYAANGQQALHNLEQYNPDLILLDVMMPDMDGIEVCRRIKSQDSTHSIPIMMVTALTSKEELAHCFETGADDFINKPVNGIELRARVKSLLKIKQHYDKLEAFSQLQRDTIDALSQNLQTLKGNITRQFPHELNTPLNGIVGVLNLLQDSHRQMDPDDVDELLELAVQSAQRLEKLSQKFLHYAELELHPEQVSQGQTHFLSHVLRCQLEKIITSHTCHSEFQIQPALLPLKEHFLAILLQELIDNAAQFAPPQSTIQMHSFLQDGFLHIDIHNIGPGIPPEDLARLMTAMPLRPVQQSGLGLGLPIVHKIVDLVGGLFQLSSTCGHKTTASVILPILTESLE